MGILATSEGVLFLPVDMIEATHPASSIEAWRQAREAEKRKDAARRGA